MNLFVDFLLDNGFSVGNDDVPLLAKLEWVSGLSSPFINWLFERIESIPLLDADTQIRQWNGLTSKISNSELDGLEAQIRQLDQESQNIKSKCNSLKLSMYDTSQTNSELKAMITQKREKIAYKDHLIAETSEKINHCVNRVVGRINDEIKHINAKEYVFQKSDSIKEFKINCTNNVNSLLANYQVVTSQLHQYELGKEFCFEIDQLRSQHIASYMNLLNHKLKLTELESQLELLKQRRPVNQIMMTESSNDNSGFEAKLEVSSMIKAALKEINVLITQKASYTVMMSLQQKLSDHSIQISNKILISIEWIQNLLQSYSLAINSLIQKISAERNHLMHMISLSKLFGIELEAWKSDHDEKMRYYHPRVKVSKSLVKSNHPFVEFLDGIFGIKHLSGSGQVTLLPLDEILESLKNKKIKWELTLTDYDTSIKQLEELTVSRVYQEQALLDAFTKNADAPYILLHEKSVYKYQQNVRNEVDKLQSLLAIVSEKCSLSA